MADKDDGFGLRICCALNEPPSRLAKRLGLNYSDDLLPILYVQEAELTDADLDVTYELLLQEVDTRIGELMASREALQRVMYKHRTARAERLERIRNR